MRYLLLYGRTTAKKPQWYCEKHSCGITGKCCRRRCGVCRYLVPMNKERAAKIALMGKGERGIL